MTDTRHDQTEHDVQPCTGRTYEGLADGPAATWDAPTLCENWQVRLVVAHVTMPSRMTLEQFGAAMAAAGGDFTRMSDAVAARDGALPADELLTALRSPVLHGWQPPGGGAIGGLSHAVIHSLDVTLPDGRPPVAPSEAVVAVLDHFTAAGGAHFGIDLTGVRLEATDTDRAWGDGDPSAPAPANSWPC